MGKQGPGGKVGLKDGFLLHIKEPEKEGRVIMSLNLTLGQTVVTAVLKSVGETH